MTDQEDLAAASPSEPQPSKEKEPVRSTDRNRGYVPEGMFPTGRTSNRVLVGPSDRPRVLKHGLADEQNRDNTWQWVDMTGSMTSEADEHWSMFRGHHVLVDVQYRQANRREINEWKGRDEIRAEGEWQLLFNRTQVWDGRCTADVLADLTRIASIARRLLDHDVVDWMSDVPYRRQLLGRRVWYREVPAVVSGEVLSQGCVLLRPEGGGKFPPPVWARQREPGHYDSTEDDEVKVELLSSAIWWWRS